MHIRDLNRKNICILGFGKEGRAMLRVLERYAPGCSIMIADKNKELRIKNYETQLGDAYLQNLERFDVLIKSPGISPSELLTTHYSLLTTPTQIFLDTIRDSGATVIGVTGSKGKSTTASLIFHILQSKTSNQPFDSAPLDTARGRQGRQPVTRNFLIGNIGDPAIAHLRDAHKNTIFVQEMSSYQLADLTVSPSYAVVTAFFPEHLDYHGSLETYRDAKANIARFQKPEDVIFYAAESEGARAIAGLSPGKKIPFSAHDAPVPLGETKLLGQHNLSNIAAAFLVSQELGIPRETAVEAIHSFTPLPHRLQSLGLHHGIEWVDDSISTTPQSAVAALDALGNRVTTLLLGGQDRGIDFTPLAERLKHSAVQTVILLGESSRRIKQALEKAKVPAGIFEVQSMKEAVAIAMQNSQPPNPNPSPNPIVLLSPASPSYGLFVNFEDRGNQFARCIHRQ